MDEVMAIWAEWLKPSAGLPTVQWSILLAIAAAVGHLLQRATGLPKVVGYSLVGTLAGLAGFSGAAWPLQGVALFLVQSLLREAVEHAQHPVEGRVQLVGHGGEELVLHPARPHQILGAPHDLRLADRPCL